MSLVNFFISCDWGTSNFRLRVVETNSLKVLAEHKTNQGVKALFEAFQKQKEVDQGQFFATYLKEQIQMLPEEHREHLVVSAGMASSNIGLHELGYASMPLGLSGENLLWEHLNLHNGLEVLLISGAKSETGMMRGEEVQAIGLEEHLSTYQKGTLLLPGTHSKHVIYEQGKFTDFTTFMTGELFEVLTKSSLLSNSVLANDWLPEREIAFKEGLDLGLEGKMSSNLFAVRARHLIKNKIKEDNYFFLSGLLIGDELAYLKGSSNPVFLAAPNPILRLYKLGLDQLVSPDQLVVLEGNALEKALLIGQKKIISLYGK
ncbi:2-dehydro-3-deoxygalactonokinase [Flammeovirgaceae bacterium SG7u.111]|nr:2-dehydro-3-deoxygalactonokinase [Flammeovirgaceae bacterium SG7u.132]WPO38665.1 2-dehydro-3-deoxygalactonokinase [Flammeovirgaceae bacterium SG7u.111]